MAALYYEDYQFFYYKLHFGYGLRDGVIAEKTIDSAKYKLRKLFNLSRLPNGFVLDEIDEWQYDYWEEYGKFKKESFEETMERLNFVKDKGGEYVHKSFLDT